MSKLLAVDDDRGMHPVAGVDSCWERRCRTASAVLSAGVVTIGLVVLVGWIFDIALFKSMLPTFETMGTFGFIPLVTLLKAWMRTPLLV